jgi:hypothetical protein
VASYETNEQMQTRLSQRFGITAEITVGDADIASNDVDSLGPFIGSRLADDQERQFPRNVNPDGSTNAVTDPPEAVLDWVALRAYQLSNDEDPAIKSETVGRASVVYLRGKLSRIERRMSGLLTPYLISGFGTIEVASTFAGGNTDEFVETL